jgi:hypothetical protein
VISTVTKCSQIASTNFSRNTTYKPGVAGSIPAPPTISDGCLVADDNWRSMAIRTKRE